MIKVSDSYLLRIGNLLLTGPSPLRSPQAAQHPPGMPPPPIAPRALTPIFQALELIEAALPMCGAHHLLLVYRCDSREKGGPGRQRFLGVRAPSKALLHCYFLSSHVPMAPVL